MNLRNLSQEQEFTLELELQEAHKETARELYGWKIRLRNYKASGTPHDSILRAITRDTEHLNRLSDLCQALGIYVEPTRDPQGYVAAK